MDQLDYDAADAQVLALSDALRGADAATVAAEVTRLKYLAAQITDEYSRRRALIRVEKLPELIHGPRPGTSPQYDRATRLVGQVMSGSGTPGERVDQAERAITEIGALAQQAPARESGTIMRMNSSLTRLIEALRADNSQG